MEVVGGSVTEEGVACKRNGRILSKKRLKQYENY